MLQGVGYNTFALGKWHLVSFKDINSEGRLTIGLRAGDSTTSMDSCRLKPTSGPLVFDYNYVGLSHVTIRTSLAPCGFPFLSCLNRL